MFPEGKAVVFCVCGGGGVGGGVLELFWRQAAVGVQRAEAQAG